MNVRMHYIICPCTFYISLYLIGFYYLHHKTLVRELFSQLGPPAATYALIGRKIKIDN
jgi:hypothetical protein